MSSKAETRSQNLQCRFNY